jgi:integrase
MARRGHGEGTIRKRADGRWEARVVEWQGGQRRRKSIFGKTRRAVAGKLRKAIDQAEQGIPLADGRQTVGQFLTRWLVDVARARVRPRTFDGYDAAIRRHITPYLGTRPVVKLTPQATQSWLRDLDAAGVPVSQRRYARVVLRAALNTAVRWRLVTQNAAALVDPPRAVAREIQPLTPEQARVLLDTVAGQPLEGFVAVALGCGLRLGEALGLKWEDVDLTAGTLQVRRALQRFGGDGAKRRPLVAERKRLRRTLAETKDKAERRNLRQAIAELRAKLRAVKTSSQLVEPKSARSRRTIALPSVTLAALKSHRKRQLESRLAAGDAWQDTGHVFTSPIGTAADAHNLHKQFRAVLTAARLPLVRIHDLRHSCATLLLAQGVDPRTIMQTLGHSQVSLTLNTYAHVLPSLQRDAAAKLDAILSRS